MLNTKSVLAIVVIVAAVVILICFAGFVMSMSRNQPLSRRRIWTISGAVASAVLLAAEIGQFII